MAKGQGKVGGARSGLLAQIPEACRHELAAVEFVERQRWGESPACPRCGDTSVYQMQDREGGRNKRFLWRCQGCKRQFTVRIGTIFEDSRIPLRIWCHAFWRACSSKKGVSALQIQRETGLSYKSALFLMHRIRWAMAPMPKTPRGKLTGTVEADETYVGGKPRYKGRSNLPGKRITGRATLKTPVFAVVERGGEVRTQVIDRVTKDNLMGNLRRFVDRSARVMTDEERSYDYVGMEFMGGHKTVKHGAREYVRGDVHTNTIEGFFSLIKRGMYGTFHSVSKKHLHRYVSEFEYRYNTRGLDDGARTVRAIQRGEGKRLRYREPVRSLPGSSPLE